MKASGKRAPKAGAPSAVRDTKPPVSCDSVGAAAVKSWPSAAVAPDPCRGWSRNSLARIRAQKEPVVAPAGTGADYLSTLEGSLHVSRLREVGGPFRAEGMLSMSRAVGGACC